LPVPFSWALDKPLRLTPTSIVLSHPVWAQPDNRRGVTRLHPLSRDKHDWDLRVPSQFAFLLNRSSTELFHRLDYPQALCTHPKLPEPKYQ
ncbi:MAG: hypothetical protein AAGF93_23335, partial [Cyanobacteria bacterium P01_H01_bin.105]